MDPFIFLIHNVYKSFTMEIPKSLKWALANGYHFVSITGTEHTFCNVAVQANAAPDGFRPRCMFLLSTRYMKSRYNKVFVAISYPF